MQGRLGTCELCQFRNFQGKTIFPGLLAHLGSGHVFQVPVRQLLSAIWGVSIFRMVPQTACAEGSAFYEAIFAAEPYTTEPWTLMSHPKPLEEPQTEVSVPPFLTHPKIP